MDISGVCGAAPTPTSTDQSGTLGEIGFCLAIESKAVAFLLGAREDELAWA